MSKNPGISSLALHPKKKTRTSHDQIQQQLINYLKFMDQGSTYLNMYIYRCLIIITWVWFSQEIGTKVRSTSSVAEVVGHFWGY